MPPFIIKIAIRIFGERFAKLGAWAVLLLIGGFALWWVYSSIYAAGRAAERQAWEDKVEKIVKARVKKAVLADQRDKLIRAGGEAAIAKQREELDNATKNMADESTTARQRARACAELRRQGTPC